MLFLMGLKVRLLGVRGSLPSPLVPGEIENRIRSRLSEFVELTRANPALTLEEFMASLPPEKLGGFGGNTPCIEYTCGNDRLIVDGGSGIRTLGFELMKGPCGQGKGEVHIYLTHFHWDHLIGFPFFVPLFIPGNLIHIYGVSNQLESVFRTLFQRPYFPVSYEQLGAKFVFHSLPPRVPQKLGEITFTPYQLDHPDPCWGVRVEAGGKAVAHCVDSEATRTTEDQLGPDLPLYQNADLMIFDAMYTLGEAIEKMNWGHSAATIGLDIAIRQKIKQVVFMHHDPASSDEKIQQAVRQTLRYHESQIKSARRLNETLFSVIWSFATEGRILVLE